MAMRDLVSGGAACAVPGSSSSNPLGALANSLLGSSSKAQERLRELPETTVSGVGGSVAYGPEGPSTSLPGLETGDQQYKQPDSHLLEFFQRFRDHGGLAEAWNEVQQPPLPPFAHERESQPHFNEFERIYDSSVGSHLPPALEGEHVLASLLHSFVNSGRAGVPFQLVSLPALGLSPGEKRCIRDRSSIMARHFLADKSEDYISAQVNALLHSLDIDIDLRAKGPRHGTYPQLEEYWAESQIQRTLPTHAEDRWVAEFSQHVPHGNTESWVDSFQRQHGANGWAFEFEQEHNQLMATGHLRGLNTSNLAAMEQSRMLAQTLAQNEDPKFQNSKFLQFLSKMSRGELIVDDNQIKPSGDWADEYQQQYNANSSTWADQFVREEVSRGEEAWANEFANEQYVRGEVDDQWVSEFSKLHVQDWAGEFGRQVGEGALVESSEWANAYDQFLDEQQIAAKNRSDASRSPYVFSDMNPYVGHPNPLKEGQELFRKGLLSEAVLALEAEVMKNPENAEGWRLLGITHAENDDDQQAIASMMRAHEVDPTNLEVLLALGVSHTNELEQAAALKYLYRWLQNHPKHGSVAPPEMGDFLYHADVVRLFNEAAQVSPDDADVHIVLGVLYNLTREYDKAITSFKAALELKPRDYSLWNKLGATQANSVQSGDAILAYQKALDLKPNYVRAWANMGISYANQGLYEDSIRYYVAALAMNPKAENAWQYLRISLTCTLRQDMIDACDARNLDVLQKEFPL